VLGRGGAACDVHCAVGWSCCGQNSMFAIASERQVRRMRERFLQAVLRQEIAWFDLNHAGELTTRIKGDTLLVKQGIGEKLGLFLQFFSTFVTGFIIGFTKGWKLALVMLSVVPVLALSAGMLFLSIGKLTSLGQKLYAEAGNVAEQSISAIRTVAAFTGERKEEARYGDKLRAAEVVSIRSGATIARGLATVLFVIFASYGLGMWFGAKELVDYRNAHPYCFYEMNCKINGGDILVVFW
jgi:ATP-binding cassette, subfamily B (MDR/TAP), member 1